MTEKLGAYAPTMAMVEGVRKVLLRAGEIPEEIPDAWLPTILAAVAKWIQTSEDGLEFASRLLFFNLKKGKTEKEYYCLDPYTNRETLVNHDDVWFFDGAIINGEPVFPSLIRIADRDRETCDGCSTVTHCTKKVLDPFDGVEKTLCNHCIAYHGHPRIQDKGSTHMCGECSKTSCINHPNNPKLLPAGRSYF